jgi:NADH-quinone oxidoreductase subunit J
MGAEAVLFIAVAVIAVICAAAMLLTENAVHSALFLIANFICVAFMYLILEAPFLAMVQIAVYAGAIMVLFTFVIMLLGAEKLPSGEQVRRFPWFAPLGLSLALAFLIATFFAVRSGQIDSQAAPATQGQLRVVNAAPAVVDDLTGVDGFDVYLDGELKGTLDKYSATDFAALAPGEYTLSFNPKDTENAVISGVVTLTAGSTVTAVLTGDGAGFNIDAFEDDITATDRRSGRVTIYNAYTQPVSVAVSYTHLRAHET